MRLDLDLPLPGPVEVALSIKDDEGTCWSAQAELADSDASVLIELLAPEVRDVRAYRAVTKAPFGRPAIADAAEGSIRIAGESRPFIWHPVDERVRIETVAEGRVHGRYLASADATGPSVIVVPGSAGGIDQLWGAALASIGYRVLTPALFGWPGAPERHSAVPIETLDEAARWLCERADVARVGLIGSSRGSEAVMLAGAHFPERIGAIVGLSPGNVISPGFSARNLDEGPAWTVGGEDAPFAARLAELLPPTATLSEEERLALPPFSPRSAYGEIFTGADDIAHAGIPVERIVPPLLLIAGGDDRMWPAEIAAEDLARRGRAAGRAVEAMILDGAGHFLWPPGVPTTLADIVFHPVERSFITAGGTPEAQRRGNHAAWTAIRSFFARHLEPAA